MAIISSISIFVILHKKFDGKNNCNALSVNSVTVHVHLSMLKWRKMIPQNPAFFYQTTFMPTNIWRLKWFITIYYYTISHGTQPCIMIKRWKCEQTVSVQKVFYANESCSAMVKYLYQKGKNALLFSFWLKISESIIFPSVLLGFFC